MQFTCPLCGDPDLITVIDRDRVPVFQNRVYKAAAEARAADTGRLAIRTCAGCGFVFNAAFDPGLVPYGADYENDQTVSGHFTAHLDLMADSVLGAVAAIDRPVILEIGCGQGNFLERLADRSPRPLGGSLGFDPAFRGRSTPPLRIQKRLFDAAAAADIDGPITALVMRHVIEHIADPVRLLRTIRAALTPGTEATLFLETPCVEWPLRLGVLQDFFYEHCSYFTKRTLAFALERAGWRARLVEHVFGGQYLWASATPDWSEMPARAPEAAATTDISRRFADQVWRSAQAWRGVLDHRRREGGKVALWGAAAKGVTFAHVIDPEAGRIDCLIDVNARKQGSFTPITAHPIVSPQIAVERGVTVAVIMNPNYREEIAAQVREEGLAFELLEG